MEESAKEIKFETYIKFSEEGASRSRSLISILMIASFISLLGLYNSLEPQYNWLYSRLNTLQATDQWLNFDNSEKKHHQKIYLNSKKTILHENKFTVYGMLAITKLSKESRPELFKITRQHISLSFPAYCIEDSVLSISKIDTLQLMAAMNYLTGPKIVGSQEELNRVIAYLNRAIIENALSIRIPILGIAFDVNSLAIISGAAFGVIFFLLYFYLMRERKNLKLLFNISKDFGVSRVKIYQLLSMNQVLTVPGSIDEYLMNSPERKMGFNKEKTPVSFRVNRFMTIAPLVFAALIWCCIFAYDCHTTNYGNANNRELTIYNLKISIIFGLLMILLFYFACNQWRLLNVQWDIQRNLIIEELKKERESDYRMD